MKQFAVVKKVSVVRTPNGEVEMVEYRAQDPNCMYPDNYDEGKVAIAVKGRKIPKGTEVTILRYIEDRFGRSFKGILGGGLYNPAILVELPSGEQVWTIAENFALKPESVIGWVETIEAESDKEAGEIVSKKYKDSTGEVYYVNNEGGVDVRYFGMLDGGLGVYKDCGKRYFKDCGDTIAVVLDDWRKDIYMFVAFTKEPKLNNVVKYVSKGQPRIKGWDAGETGLGEAIKAYEKYVAEHNGKLVA